MSDGINRPLYSGIGSPELDEVLGQIRQGATQAKGGNILQSLLSEAMKSSGRTGGVPGAGSPGTILPTRMPSIAMPKPPVKDKAAAAREYKKQQQAALRNAYKEIEKGKEGATPYTKIEEYKIMQKHGVDENTILGTFNLRKQFEGEAQAQPISDKQRKQWGLPEGSYSIGATGKPELISMPKKDDIAKVKAAEKLATAKTTAAGKVATAKTDKETRDRIYDMSKSIATYVDKDTKKKFVNDEQANIIASDALKLMEEDGLDEGVAVNRAAFNVKGDDLEFLSVQSKWYEAGYESDREEAARNNFEGAMDFAKQAHQSGITTKEISDKLVNSGRPLKEGEDSVEAILEAVDLSPVVEEAEEVVYNNPEEVQKALEINEIGREEAEKQLLDMGIKYRGDK